MAFKAETTRGELYQIRRTTIDLEDAIAGAAAEVMVVLLACHLVTRRFTGQSNRLQPAICNQRFEVAVHRGDTQSRHVRLGGRKHLVGAQRTVGFVKNSAYRLALSGVTVHGRTIHEAPNRSKRPYKTQPLPNPP